MIYRREEMRRVPVERRRRNEARGVSISGGRSSCLLNFFESSAKEKRASLIASLCFLKRAVQRIKLILWSFLVDTSGSAFTRRINVHVVVLRLVICTEQKAECVKNYLQTRR